MSRTMYVYLKFSKERKHPNGDDHHKLQNFLDRFVFLTLNERPQTATKLKMQLLENQTLINEVNYEVWYQFAYYPLLIKTSKDNFR